MIATGALRITIDLETTDLEGRGPAARIERPAPAPLGRLLRGKTPEAAAALAPLVFNLCAAAQEAAARAALDLPPAPGAGRRIAAETLREHALRCLKDWPAALGAEPDLAALAGAGRLAEAGGAPDEAATRLGRVETALFGGQGVAALDDMASWIRSGAGAARHIRAVAAWPGPEPGAHGPIADDPTIVRRVLDDPRLAALRGALTDLGLRMAARAVDAARMIEVLRDGRPPPEAERLGPGVGAAEAARGRLTHRARVSEGRIADYSVETPTDKALADDGLLARLLAAAAQAPPGRRAQAAAIAVHCVDPCAPVILEVARAEPVGRPTAELGPAAQEAGHA